MTVHPCARPGARPGGGRQPASCEPELALYFCAGDQANQVSCHPRVRVSSTARSRRRSWRRSRCCRRGCSRTRSFARRATRQRRGCARQGINAAALHGVHHPDLEGNAPPHPLHRSDVCLPSRRSNAIRRPSGDRTEAKFRPPLWVSLRWPLPSAFMTQTTSCSRGDPPPVGRPDEGLLSRTALLVSLRCSFPSVFMT